ncbi:gdp-l-fucose synthetase [hydrocarbon metagenome]|uniref:GDP-L-fucose synthase n=1 Tax=hydrocarbon metagenome TaxID=938273 RepID=A0A0W8G357_9ZZZZ
MRPLERSEQPRIFVAGHGGMVGSALVRQLTRRDHGTILTAGREDCDLLKQRAVEDYFRKNRPEAVYLAAAKVGGIYANTTFPADFIYENLMIQCNVIHAAHQAGVQRLLFLGSSCIYPKFSPQPIPEEALLTGVLEPTNEPYAIAKIAGIKLCESYNRQFGRDYRSVMPTNLYGPGDNFHPRHSHVIPALMRRFHEAVRDGAPEVVIWGSGAARREFLHVDDMAEACIHVMGLSEETYRGRTQPMLSHINIGSGRDCTIRELAQTMAEITGFTGRLVFDAKKPEGTPRKVLEVSRLTSLGWQAKISLRDGLASTYAWFVNQARRREK